MDIDKTKEALMQTFKWRQDNKIDTILKEYSPDQELVKLFPYEIIGHDKENCPSKSLSSLFSFINLSSLFNRPPHFSFHCMKLNPIAFRIGIHFIVKIFGIFSTISHSFRSFCHYLNSFSFFSKLSS